MPETDFPPRAILPVPQPASHFPTKNYRIFGCGKLGVYDFGRFTFRVWRLWNDLPTSPGFVRTSPGFVRTSVSVSAMPPCTQSFIPLPLPHEYNLNDMIASKRYESVWNTFLKELTRDSAVTLSSLQKKWHVNRSGMKQWMRDNGLSVKEAKKHIHECRHYAEEGQMLPLPATAGNLFLPMTTDQPALQPESCDILSGVSLVFPDGTQVNIRRGSAQAVMSFLKLYQREDLPCLD